MRSSVTAALVVVLLLPSLARAQAPTGPTSPVADAVTVTRAAQDAVEDVVLTRVIVSLKLSASQMGELLPLLQDAQTRLQTLDRENADAIGRHQKPLEEARNQLLAGKSVSSRAETQYAETVKLAET